MNISEFVAGRWIQQNRYKSFSPSPVNHEWFWTDPVVNTLLEAATQGLARLDTLSESVPNVDMYIRMHVLKEANMSSRIEGTQTEMDEAASPESIILEERKNDWHEVRNYVVAMNKAIRDLEKLPLSNRMLRDTHAILMQSVRGQHKGPGEFRRSQNWIGGTMPSNAFFVPPAETEVQDLMSDLEKFLHNHTIHVPHLIRIAIAHYQFETIHPFQDGNGRIGRLLITLYLVNAGVLSRPTLYLSAYLEKYKNEYFESLTRVRVTNALNSWIQFFLTAVIETAESAIETFRAITILRRDLESNIVQLKGRAPNAKALLEHLFENPVIISSDVEALLNVTHPTANALIKEFVAMEILVQTGKRGRHHTYQFARYLRLFY